MKEQYLSLSAIQLAAEEEFIAWVTHGAQASEWEQWVTTYPQVRSKVEQGKSIVETLSGNSQFQLTPSEKREMWEGIITSIAHPKPEKNKTRTLSLRWITVAAAAIALLLWVTLKNNMTHVIADVGEQKEIQLPEKSIVKLNAGSSIAYDDHKFTTDRKIKLNGEAFFKVNPGSRFTVLTDKGSVTVLGTSFNVIAWPDRFEVSCYTGKVLVKNNHQDEATITPGSRVMNDPDGKELVEKTFKPTSDLPEWTSGKFIFEDQPLKVVVKELERQYDVKVHLGHGLDDMRYTGLFESGELDTALYMITWPLHLKANQNGKTVLIAR